MLIMHALCSTESVNRFNTVNSVAGEEMDTVGKKIYISFVLYLSDADIL